MEKWSLSNYSYDLPADLIAQDPITPRDKCKLLVLNRREHKLEDRIFSDILDFFKKDDVLVLNDTKVIRARIKGRKKDGGKLEVLLLREIEPGTWEALVKPGKRARENSLIIFQDGKLEAKIIGRTQKGSRVLRFNPADLDSFLPEIGETPLPPYIKKPAKLEDYQTVYAKHKGAVAAPTAGLHFTNCLLDKIIRKGVKIFNITLHCSLATFRPVKTEDIRDHDIETEYLEVSSEVAEAINAAKRTGARVIAVGTTVVRSLESVAGQNSSQEGALKPYSGETKLYIVPGYKFKVVDAVITNFHTSCSTNLILVSSFADPDFIKASYIHAKENGYRFYSFGDAMLIF